MREKIKVVLLCQFWNSDVDQMIDGNAQIPELSPWIQEILNLFKDKDDIELHIVAPNYQTNKNFNFLKNNLYYHFYRYSPYYIPKAIIYLYNFIFNKSKGGNGLSPKANILTFYTCPRHSIGRIIKSIKPDLIHLYGSENLDYSVGIFGFLKTYPVLLTIQGYAYLQNSPVPFFEKIYHYLRTYVEKKINRQVKYLANLIKSDYFKPFENNQSFFYCYPPTRIPCISANNIIKEYDVVFYARICKEKGIEDLIKAIELLSKKKVRLKTLIIGKSSSSYIDYLKVIIVNNGIDDLFTFAGFIDDHEEVYIQAAKARMLVLPTHNDGFNNTIREAMQMKLPVVANAVGGIPIANKNQECITLTKLGDVEDLANKILIVLNDTQRTDRLLNNAYNEMCTRYNPQGIYEMTLNIYQKVVTDYHNIV